MEKLSHVTGTSPIEHGENKDLYLTMKKVRHGKNHTCDWDKSNQTWEANKEKEVCYAGA